jgi:hypothetical protein
MKKVALAFSLLLGGTTLAAANCGFGPGGYETCPGPAVTDDKNHYETNLPVYTSEYVDFGDVVVVVLRTNYGTTVGWANCIRSSGRCDVAAGYELALKNAESELRKQENYRRGWNF